MDKILDVAIIGSGPAGYTAAIYASRANLKPTLFTGIAKGGQLMLTNDIENFPGFEAISGQELMQKFESHAEKFGTTIIQENIESVNFDVYPFELKYSGETVKSRSVIIATGAKAKWLGIQGETEFMGRGVSACATCDGFFFVGDDIVVVGGGNTAVEEALYLSSIGCNVTLIHRRDKLRAEPIMIDRLMANDKINIIWNSNIGGIIGDDNGVTSVKIVSNHGGENIKNVTGVFVAIGHEPQTSLFVDTKLNIDEEGYITVDAGTPNTNIKGVFSCGDVSDKIYKQAITAAGMGCQAALNAQKFIDENKEV